MLKISSVPSNVQSKGELELQESDTISSHPFPYAYDACFPHTEYYN